MVTVFLGAISPPRMSRTNLFVCRMPWRWSRARLEENRLKTSAKLGHSTGDIFAAQLQMLHDPRLTAELRRRITEQQQSAAYAVSQVLHNYADAMRRLKSSLLADRAEDVLDIEKQLLLALGAVTSDPLKESDRIGHRLSP